MADDTAHPAIPADLAGARERARATATTEPALDPAHTLAELDRMHGHLDELNTALEAAVEGAKLRAARWFLDELLDHTSAHFRLEEALMRDSGFPGRGPHLADHAAYLEELRKIRQDLAATGLTPRLTLWFRSRCAGWMRAHARGMDRSMTRHVARWIEAGATAEEAEAAKGGQEPDA